MFKIKTIKKNISHTIEQLPPHRLQEAWDFINYLKEKDEELAETGEILANKKLFRAIKTARRNWEQGNTKRFVSWHSVKRYV